jgi:isoquinoline 1-oxidoreductase/isoquinoline 1-oxidoreductase beta subunit
VNPDIVKMQMESCIIFGATAALYGEITLQDGQVQQSNFHDYPIMRMNQSPEIEVFIMDSDASPTGVGEPGLPPLAPAIASALYKATNKRFRDMPFKLG